MPKISVVIPVYNVEKYLEECLDSVVNQTLKDIEIIIVDDGSTDSSPAICDKYASKDKRIKVIHKNNEGVGKAYNIGLENSSGEYIGFIESDDFAELNMFENLYNTAKEHNADIVKSNWYKYWSKPFETNCKVNSFEHLEIGVPTNIKQEPKLLGIFPSIWSSIYKKDFITSNNIRFLETPGASYQDTSFAFKTTASAERFILLNDTYVHYRQDNENSSVKSKDKVFVICEEYKEIEKYLDVNPKIKVLAETYKWINQYHGYKWNLNRISVKYHRDFLDMYSTTFKHAYEKNLLNEDFFKKINIKEFDLLINNKNKFLKIQIKNKKKEIRKNFISLKISSKQLRFSFLGKEYFNWKKYNG